MTAPEPIATESTTGEDRILTAPNVITLVRLACLPLFLWLLFARDNRHAAAWLLGALGATDWVDGFVARRYHQVSNIGKVLDPTADRLLLGVALVAMLVDGSVPTWVAGVTIVREILVSAAVLGLAALGARRIDVQWVGKAGTFCLMFAFPFFLVSEAGVNWADIARVLAWAFTAVGIPLSWYAAATYIPLARRALAEARVESPG